MKSDAKSPVVALQVAPIQDVRCQRANPVVVATWACSLPAAVIWAGQAVESVEVVVPLAAAVWVAAAAVVARLDWGAVVAT